jgi:hypothetical protein
LRGNSASGKSSVAAGVRERYGRGIAIVGQDNLRRTVLREHDKPKAANIGLIGLTARYALDHGFHVIVEGILYASHYGDMLTALCADHRGATRLYYLHVPFAETLRRHATKAEATKYGEAEMATWYRELDLLPGVAEQIVSAETSLSDIVQRVMTDTGLASQPATSTPLQILLRTNYAHCLVAVHLTCGNLRWPHCPSSSCTSELAMDQPGRASIQRRYPARCPSRCRPGCA